MTRLVTINFAIPDDDPAHDQGHLVREIQGLLYDGEGMAGSFRVVSNVEFDGDPAPYGFDDSTKKPWFALTVHGELIPVGEHETFDDADQYTSDRGLETYWLADVHKARQWLNVLVRNL